MRKNRIIALVMILALFVSSLASCARTPEDIRDRANKKLSKKYEMEFDINFACDDLVLGEIFEQLERTEIAVYRDGENLYTVNRSKIDDGSGENVFTNEYTFVGDTLYLNMTRTWKDSDGVDRAQSAKIKGTLTSDERAQLISNLCFIGDITADDFTEISERFDEDALITVYSGESDHARIVMENSLLAMLESAADSAEASNLVMTVEIEDGEYESIKITCDYVVVIGGLTVNTVMEMEIEFDFDDGVRVKAPADASTYTDTKMSEYLN